MIWLSWKLLTLPVRVVFATLAVTFRTVRFVGISRVLAFLAGVGAGMRLGPDAAHEVKARLAGAAGGGAGGGAAVTTELASTVRDELAQSSRTWHHPQPQVTVSGNRVTLTGQVPHDDARSDLGRVAGAVAGVAAVDNRIEVVPGS
jgi:osmotically-inducible protein OsmY